MTRKKKKSVMGRPPKPAGEKYLTPARQIGRVPDAEWAEVKAAVPEGKTLTAWAMEILLAAAARKKPPKK